MQDAEERRLRRMEQYVARGSDRLPASGGKATPPFGFAQGHEPVECQMMPGWWIRAFLSRCESVQLATTYQPKEAR
jgi:hypothetical protein